MTLITSAIRRAYKRRSSDGAPATNAAPAVDMTRGWSPLLRPPVSRLGVTLRTTSDASEREPAHASRSDPITAPADPLDRNHRAFETGYMRVDPSHAEPVSGSTEVGVNGWSWPPICERILRSSAEQGLQELANQLLGLCALRRIRHLAFTGAARGAGRTALVLSLARLLVENCDARVALVDCDFGHPELASLLGVAVPEAKSDAVQGQISTDRAISLALSDRLRLLPSAGLIAPQEIDAPRVQALVALWREAGAGCAVTLIDAGPWSTLWLPLLAGNGAFDALIEVHRAGEAYPAAGKAALDSGAGVELLGTIETFAETGRLPEPHFPG